MKIVQQLLAFILVVSVVPLVYADDDDFSSWFFSMERKKGVVPVKDKVYLEECGACHFAYQPGLLPAASWGKLIAAKALEDHFDENAELDEETRQYLETYLKKHAADNSMYKRSKKIMASLKSGEAPLRITEVPYIKRKHDEISDKYIKGNPKVKALSFCDKCHTEAESGNYDEDSVRVPGYENKHW